MGKTFEHKGVYHSALVQATDPAGLVVKFTGQVHESKYPGKPPFIGFQVYGDDDEYLLNIENGDVQTAISHVPQDTWVTIHAFGSRDAANVSFEDKDGSPVFASDTASDISQPPPHEWPADMKPAPKGNTVQRFAEVYRGLEDVVKPRGDTAQAALIEATQKIVVTELIQK